MFASLRYGIFHNIFGQVLYIYQYLLIYGVSLVSVAKHFLISCRWNTEQLKGFRFPFQPDLLPLIEGPCLNSETAGKQQISSEEEPGVEIAEIWQRTYNDKWLVAVSFRNKCSR